MFSHLSCRISFVSHPGGVLWDPASDLWSGLGVGWQRPGKHLINRGGSEGLVDIRLFSLAGLRKALKRGVAKEYLLKRGEYYKVNEVRVYSTSVSANPSLVFLLHLEQKPKPDGISIKCLSKTNMTPTRGVTVPHLNPCQIQLISLLPVPPYNPNLQTSINPTYHF